MSTAIIVAADVLDALVSASQAIATLGPIYQRMQAEGRTVLTDAEYASISQTEATAAQNLLTAIKSARKA